VLKVKTGVAAMFVVFLMGMIAVTVGCSQSRQAQASEKLIGEVEKAQKLYQTCLAYLANPVYRVNNDYPPVQSRVPAGADIAVGEPGQLHPEVLPTLKKIETDLSAALAAEEHAAAGPEEKSLAYQMLAKAYALRAYCELFPTVRAYDRLVRQRDDAEKMLFILNSRADLLTHYKSLSALETDDLVALRDEARKQQADVEARIKDIDERLAAMATEKQAQAQTYEKRNAEARSLALESAVGSAKAGMAKLEEALRLRTEANKAHLLMAELEYEADSLAEKRKALELALSAAKAKILAADGALADRKAISEANQINAEQVAEQLRDSQSKLVASLQAMQETCSDLAAALAKAANAYELALAQLRKAANANDKSLSIREADVLMGIADMEARALGELEANKSFAASLSRAWAKLAEPAPPSGIDKIQSLLPDPASSRSDAEAKYTKAAQLYQRAMSGADRNVRWIYEGQLAAAYVRLYMLNGDPETLKTARETLASALEGKELSPHLSSIAELQDLLAAQ